MPGGVHPDPRRKTCLRFGGLFSWFCVGIVIGEVRDPPVDPVRVLVTLILSALLAWFIASIFTRAARDRR